MTKANDFCIGINIVGNVKKIYIEGDMYIHSNDKSTFYNEFNKLINKFKLAESELDELYFQHYNAQFHSK